MTDGYIYCMSNPSMPGILKVGMTERTPEERASELFTTGVALPIVIEFAKKVKDPRGKERTLHLLLDKYTNRVSTRREFFRVSLEEIRPFFDLIDGDIWPLSHSEEEEEEDTDLSHEILLYNTKRNSDISRYFKNGQRIRHTIGGKICIGIYDSSKNGIISDGVLYTSLTKFATAHVLRDYNSDRQSERNGWKWCECEVDGVWISTKSLPK